jgi:hypothetical protein
MATATTMTNSDGRRRWQ